MNERIQELAKQAGLVQGSWANAAEVRIWKEDPDNPGSLNKFADLIIQKCVMIGNYAHDGGEYPGPMIKEYFGVES